MERFTELIIIMITIILLVMVIGVAIYTCTDDVKIIHQEDLVNPINSGEKIETICEHNYDITSEYDWFRGLYRTISKCAKCGHVVR